MQETLDKLSDAEKQTDLLEFKGARYFHGTDWLAKFEEIHQIWSPAAAWTRQHYKNQLSREENAFDDSVPPDLSDQLSKVSQQLSEKTAELLERFALLLKKLPPGSGVFKHVPTPTPTPAFEPN